MEHGHYGIIIIILKSLEIFNLLYKILCAKSLQMGVQFKTNCLLKCKEAM